MLHFFSCRFYPTFKYLPLYKGHDFHSIKRFESLPIMIKSLLPVIVTATEEIWKYSIDVQQLELLSPKAKRHPAFQHLCPFILAAMDI